MTKQIIHQWLHDGSTTATQKNHKAYMDLISKRVNLLGVPGFESIDFDQFVTA